MSLIGKLPALLLATHIAVALAGSSASAATFTLDRGEDGFDFIYIEGEIRPGDEDHFQRLAIGSDRAAVVLSGPGGALVPALEIGKTIQLKGFATFVPEESECTSACALIWVAGSTRFLAPGSRVGFHASYRDNNGRLEEAGSANAMVGRYLTLLNLPERAVIFATSASPTTVSWLNQSNSARAGIDFELIDLNETTRSTTSAAAPDVASADSTFDWAEGVWSVWRDDSDGSCGMRSEFTSQGGEDNFSTFGVIVDPKDSQASLMFFNEAFKSIVDGETYNLEVVFLKDDNLDDGWGTRQFLGMHTEIGNGLATLLPWAELERDLRSSDTVGFFKGDTLADTYPLEGVARALTQLGRCLQTGTRRTVVLDPFAN